MEGRKLYVKQQQHQQQHHQQQKQQQHQQQQQEQEQQEERKQEAEEEKKEEEEEEDEKEEGKEYEEIDCENAFRFTMVGDGHLREHILTLARGFNLTDNLFDVSSKYMKFAVSDH